MSRVIVTGANGFVGKHLVNDLVNRGVEVLCIVGTSFSSEQNKNVISVDLTKKSQVAKFIDFTEIDGVIHLAGLAAVGKSFEKPLEYIKTNSAMQINLMQRALEQNSHARFLIVSSGSVYGTTNTLPLTESSAIVPISPYAVSKLTQESLALYYSTRGLKCIIARPFNHIGPGQGVGFIVPDLAAQIYEARKQRIDKIFVGNLDARRDYTDVRDIVRAYRLLLERGKSGEVYNICSGVAISGHQILENLINIAGLELSTKIDSSKLRPTDNPIIYGSNNKLKEETGWQPTIPIQQTLKDVLYAL